MTSWSTRQGVTHVRPLLYHVSPGTIQENAARRRSHSATPNIDDKDSLFSELSAPLTEKHKERLSRLDELYASRDSANGSLNDTPHLVYDDHLSPRWSYGVQLQQCPATLTRWSSTLSDADDMKRGNSDDDDGYSVYSDWDCYHLALDRTARTKPKMTEDDQILDPMHEAFNRLSRVISCTAVDKGTAPAGPSRSPWEQSLWDALFGNGRSPVGQQYDPACPTDIPDLSAVRTAFQRAHARTSLPLAVDDCATHSRIQGLEATMLLSPRKRVMDTPGWKPVPPDLNNHRIERGGDERDRARSGGNNRTHCRSRERPSSHGESVNRRRTTRDGNGREQRSGERYRTTICEGERRSGIHLGDRSSKGNIDGESNNMLSEKELLRIFRLVHSGQLEPAMHKTLVQIIPEVVGRHTTQSCMSIDEVSQDTKYIAWQLKVLSPAASFPQILASIPFLRKLFFQFKFPDALKQDGLPLSSQRRPSTLSPERRIREPEVGAPSRRKRKPDASPDPYPRRRIRRHSSTNRLDRRRRRSRSSSSHKRRIDRPLATPRDWLKRRRSVFRTRHAVRMKYQLRTSTVHSKEMVNRSRTVGRLPRRASPSDRRRSVDREKKRRMSSHREKNPVSHQRGASPTHCPKTSRTRDEQNRQIVTQVVEISLDSVSSHSAEAKATTHSSKDRDSSDVSTSKTNVSKNGDVASASQSKLNINPTENRTDNPPTKPSDSNLKKPSTDSSTTRKTITNTPVKPPNLLSIQNKFTPLLDFDLGMQLPGIDVARSALFPPRPPLLPTPHPRSAFPCRQPLFPISPYLNYFPQRCPQYHDHMSWRLRGPQQMMHPAGNQVHSGVKPFL